MGIFGKFLTAKPKKSVFLTAKYMQQAYKNKKINKFWTTFGQGTNVDIQQQSRISTWFH